MADWAYTDVPSQAGKLVLITGASQGLGLSLAQDFLNPAKIPADKQPAKLILACRSKQRAEAAIKESEVLRAHWGEAWGNSKLQLLELDLADLKKVRAAADELKTRVSKLDCLVLNAGVWPTARDQTADGHELTFGVCHLGHFLFTKLIWDLVLKADGGHARVVPVASVAHMWTKMQTGFEMLEDLQFEKAKFNYQECYARTKLVNVLFAKELARRVGTFGQTAEQLAALPDADTAGVRVTVTSNSPGYANSGLYAGWNCMFKGINSILASHPDALSINTMRAATDLTLASGCYLSPKKSDFWGPPIVKDSSQISQSEELAKRVWEETERILGEKFELGAK